MADTDAFEYDVFLSHNRADKDWTRMLAARIEREKWNGRTLKTFYSERDIRPGQSIPQRMQDALTKSRKVALILSPEALASPWVEVEYLSTLYSDLSARQEHLIPLMHRDCKPPYLVAPLRYVDFRDDANFEQAFRELLAVIKDEPLPDAVGAIHESSLHTAPIPRMPVVGFVTRRDKDGNNLVEYVGGLLANDNAFVVLWGEGGTGKTALAAEIARRHNTVVWVSADGRADFSLGTLLDATVTQLGYPNLCSLNPEEKVEVARRLLIAPRVLVVLDNFETILGLEQTRLSEFLATAPCAALVTSRIRKAQSQVIPIGAMEYAEAHEFVSKLVDHSPRRIAFAGLDIGQIIKTADANPKVMEWIVAQIEEAKEPQRVFDELSRGRGDAAQRVFDRSFNLEYLGDDGQSVLLVLTLFVPTCSRSALAEVTGLSTEKIDNAITRLVSLRLAETKALNSRIGVAGLTRELAKSHRDQDERNEEWTHRFVNYFVRQADSHVKSKDLNALEVDRDNLLAAMEVAFKMKDLKTVRRIAYVIVGSAGLIGLSSDWDNVVVRAKQMDKSARDLQGRGPARHLRIYFARSNDQDEDVRRMRELLSLLLSIPGRDRFTFFIPNPQGTVQLDFPNFTTSYVAVQEPLDELVSEWGAMEVQ